MVGRVAFKLGKRPVKEAVTSSIQRWNPPYVQGTRRSFLSQSGLLLSGTAIAMLSGREALAAAAEGSQENDVRVLNTALGAEFEAIAAYQVGAQSGLLKKPILDVAVTFQGHHKEHATILSQTITKLGRFLADPLKVAPGTSMGYAGVKDDQERADLIAYLKQKSGAPECKQ
ncbi:hypothetical protein CS8_096120 [Cupriavidus sp. 8B]